jgi:hypothetical protein
MPVNDCADHPLNLEPFGDVRITCGGRTSVTETIFFRSVQGMPWEQIMVPCHRPKCPGHGFPAFLDAYADVLAECEAGEPKGSECGPSEVQACGLGPLFGWLRFHFVISITQQVCEQATRESYPLLRTTATAIPTRDAAVAAQIQRREGEAVTDPAPLPRKLPIRRAKSA